MSQPKCEVETTVETTQLNILPFKNMKKIKSHVSSVYGSTSVLFPDGKIRIITCSGDKTLRIFDSESLKCEKIVKHSSELFSIHFYKEEELLMTTDRSGELCFWNLFSSEIRVIKRMKISKPYSDLWRLTQISSSLFFCCVKHGSSEGCLYSIKIENKNINEIKINEIKYPLIKYGKKEELDCIYKLKSEKNTILFSGGEYYQGENTIKKFNFKTHKHLYFPKKHSKRVCCLISYFNEKNEEIILSGSEDKKLLFWNLDGQNIKEIVVKGHVNGFLNSFRRNKIFIATGYDNFIRTGYDGYYSGYCIFSLDLKTTEMIEYVDLIHSKRTISVNWVNEENQNRFITCSEDTTFNIFELIDTKQKEEKEDLKERISDLRDKEFILNNFSSDNNKENNKMIFSIRCLNSVQIIRIFKTLLI